MGKKKKFSLQCKDSQRSFHLQIALEQSPSPDKSRPFSGWCPRSQGRAPLYSHRLQERKRPSEGGDPGIHLARCPPTMYQSPQFEGGVISERATLCPIVAKPGYNCPQPAGTAQPLPGLTGPLSGSRPWHLGSPWLSTKAPNCPVLWGLGGS